MRFINRAFALSVAVLIMAAAGSASAAWNYQGKNRHRIVKEQNASAVPSADEAARGATTPLYAKGRCSTIKPFPCKPKRTESMAS